MTLESEDENVAGDRPVEKNISREDAHAAGGASLHVDGAEKAAGIMESLLPRENYIPAEVDYVRRELRNAGQPWRQKQGGKNQAPWKHTGGFLR